MEYPIKSLTLFIAIFFAPIGYAADENGENPDGITFGLRSFSHIIHIDEDKPRFHRYGEDGRFYLYDEGNLLDLTSAEFEQRVLNALEQQQRAVNQ